MSHISEYLTNLAEDTPEAVASVRETVDEISKNHLANFSHMNHDCIAAANLRACYAEYRHI